MNVYNKKIIAIFIAIFLFSSTIALTGYINSTVMESIGLSTSSISILYILSALGSLVLFPVVARITNTIGNLSFLISLLTTSLLSILILIIAPFPFLKTAAFLYYLICNSLIIFEIDVFLNHLSDAKNTGKIRGFFYTIINATWMFGPLLAGYIFQNQGANIIYMIAGGMIVVTGVIMIHSFRKTVFHKRPTHKILETISKITKNPTLKNIFTISTLLHLFYAFSFIYVPLYLTQIIGFSWVQVGWLILVANIPYILFGYLTGYLSDIIGERLLVITGLIIGALGITGFILLQNPHLIAWSIVFFINRLGITLIETASESYTFKHIDRDDDELLGFQREATPLGYLLAPAIGFIVSLVSVSYIPIFIIVAWLFVAALIPATKLR